MNERLTLEKIGELTGVSRATVSRVVNNHPHVRADVRARVLAAIEQTGYQPHLIARSLASSHSGVIGLIIPRIVQSLFTDPYYPRLIQGVAQTCNDHNVVMALFMFHSEHEEERLFPILQRPGLVDGVIIASAQKFDPLVERLAAHAMPFVVIGRPANAPEVSFVDVDNVTGAYTAVTHLIQQGRRRIAIINGRQDMSAGIDRREGALQALGDNGLMVDEALLVDGRFEESGAYDAMLALLPRQPDAVFAASDAMALGALRALHAARIAVPDQVAVVGFDDLPAAAIATPPLTTIHQPIRSFGALAAETLLDIIANGAQPPRHIILPNELIIRATSDVG